ncbi:MAG: DUF4395 family protein [Saccharofermentanales bacterium]
MIRMVKVYRQSIVFCKYAIAGLLWIAIIFQSPIPVFLVLALMAVSALTGVERAPLVVLYDKTFAKWFTADEEYINMYSMRFAHLVAVSFSIAILISYYFLNPIAALILAIIQAVLQSIASFGYCSAQKLYECVVCNSNCCRVGRIGRKLRGVHKNVR